MLSQQIRSRLMGALRVSYDNLNNLVKFLSGADETIIELDSDYLTNLYRLARLPGLLVGHLPNPIALIFASIRLRGS